MKKLTYLLALLPLLFASCEKVIDFDMDETENLIVLNAVAETDSAFTAQLTYSRFFLDDRDFVDITDATTWIDVNGNPFNGSHLSQGCYSFPYTPQPGDSLTMHVQVPGRDELTAAVRMPKAAGISDMAYNVIQDSAVYEWGEVDHYYTLKVSFSLSDPADEENYYRLRVIYDDTALCRRWTDHLEDSLFEDEYNRCYVTYIIQDPAIINNTDLSSVVNSESGEYTGRALLFTDANINGKSHTIRLQVVNPVSYGETLVSSHPNITFIVESLSRDYYLYLKTANAQSDDDLSGYFTEPTRVHTNVNGGRGILAAVSPSRATIRTTIKP